MADIELVIKIPEEIYQKIKETSSVISGRRSGKRIDYILFDAVNTGTPLPKGHGRLIDADELFLDIQTDEQMRLGEHLAWVKERIDNAQTIIEADKETEE